MKKTSIWQVLSTELAAQTHENTRTRNFDQS